MRNMNPRVGRPPDDRRLGWALRWTALGAAAGALVLAALLGMAGRDRSPKAGTERSAVASAAAKAAVTPRRDPVCRTIYAPLADPDRRSFASLRRRLTGVYGDYRKSFRPGHLHAGIDIQGPFKDPVFAIGKGKVHLVFRDFPNLSVVVAHSMPDGEVLYSLYCHVQDVRVAVGDEVDENTALARLFSETELAEADFGTPNHLHLEIRSSLDDGGEASGGSMTLAELNVYCRDPLPFFKRHLM